MSTFLAALQIVVKLAEEYPAAATAVKNIFASLEAKQDPTPAMRHAMAVAEAIELGLDPSKV